MAAATTLGIVSGTLRKSQRLNYGDLEAVLDAAVDEHQAGRLHNALAAYQEVLGQWLRLKWIEISGKTRTSITDPERFLQKLQSGCHLDRWTVKLIHQAFQAPADISYRVVDVIGAIVQAVCLDQVAKTKGGSLT